MSAYEERNEQGFPSMLNAAPGAAVHVGGDCSPAQASGASIVWKEQAQKWLVPIIALLVLALTTNAVIMGLNLSEQGEIQRKLRDTQVSEDLRRYETSQLRVQAEVNQELIKAFAVMRGCNQ